MGAAGMETVAVVRVAAQAAVEESVARWKEATGPVMAMEGWVAAAMVVEALEAVVWAVAARGAAGAAVLAAAERARQVAMPGKSRRPCICSERS